VALQCVAACCSVSVLQCVTLCYSVLQCVVVCCSGRSAEVGLQMDVWCVLHLKCCSVLQCVAVCCSVNVLQCSVMCCSVLQCVAVANQQKEAFTQVPGACYTLDIAV